MNLPPGSRLIIDRTNEPNHAPGELVLLVEAPGLEIQAKRDTVSGDYIFHGSVVRGHKHSYTFAVRRVPHLSGVRAMAAAAADHYPICERGRSPSLELRRIGGLLRAVAAT